MKTGIFAIMAFFAVTFSYAEIQLETVKYTVGDQEYIGCIARPAKMDATTKTILIVHEWWGLDDYPKMRARQLAEQGFIAFCIDMYGDGKIAANPQEAGALAGVVYKDPKILYERFMGGYTTMLEQKGVNAGLVAAIGYCFGGSVVLNAAKMGAPIDAVVSFHGSLAGVPAQKNQLNAAVLVCNGAADSFVTQAEIDAFKADMKSVDADFVFINYADATHAFTNPAATENGKKFNMPIAYNEAADKKSYADFLKFIKEKVK